MLPIIGTEALAAGELTRGALRWNYTAVHPDVYLRNDARTDLFVRSMAAWLWTGRKGIVAGRAAAALHGVGWVDETIPIELIAGYRRPQPGVVIRGDRIGPDEVCEIGGMSVTTSARTALDLARQLPRDCAVAHLDALAAVSGVTASEVHALAERHRGARGSRRTHVAVGLMDGGARSREETWLRLLLIDAGLPRPRTNIAVRDDHWEATIAIGWDGPMVGLDYRHDASLADHAVQRIASAELFQRCGWLHLTVVRRHPPRSIIYRVRAALRHRTNPSGAA